MKKPLNFVLTIVLLLISELCFSQISMGTIEQKKESKEEIKAPLYDSIQSFTEYGSYYNYDVPKDKRCSESVFYERYVGLQIYYPMFSDDYRADEVIIFKKAETVKLLNWSDIGDKYFTIIDIKPSFENTNFFEDVKLIKHNIPINLADALMFKLIDNSNNDTIYVVEPSYSVKFILVPYFLKINQIIENNIFVANKGFNARKVPLSNDVIYVDKGSEWKGKLTILSKKELIGGDYQYADAEDIKFMVVLTHDSDKIIINLHSKDHYEYLDNLFTSKKEFEKQKQLSQSVEKLKIDNLTKKYGSKFGKEIYEHKVSIGMSKEMCEKSLGVTLNRRSYTNASNKIDVWVYVGFGKLYFTDGKLSNIVKY